MHMHSYVATLEKVSGEKMKRLQHVKALSPIVSTLILIVAALVGATLIYRYFTTASLIATTKPELVIEDASYNPASQTLFMSIRNMGLVTVQGIEIHVICSDDTEVIIPSPSTTILSPADIDLTQVKLNPGDTLTVLVRFLSTTCIAQQVYLVYGTPSSPQQYVSKPITVIVYG